MEAFLTMAPGDKRQIQPFVPRGGQVPSAVWIEIAFRAQPATRYLLVRYADHIEGEIMERVAKMPLCQTVFVVGPV